MGSSTRMSSRDFMDDFLRMVTFRKKTQGFPEFFQLSEGSRGISELMGVMQYRSGLVIVHRKYILWIVRELGLVLQDIRGV